MGKGLVYLAIGTLALLAAAIVSTLRLALVIAGFLVLALLASMSVSLLMGLIFDDTVASAAASVAFVVTLVSGPLITLSVRSASRG